MTSSNPSEAVDKSLQFTAYGKDPVLRFVLVTLKWSSLRFSVAYVIAYFLSWGLAYAIVLIRNGEIDFALEGGYLSIISFALFIVILGGFEARLYILISEKASTIYQDLAREGILDA